MTHEQDAALKQLHLGGQFATIKRQLGHVSDAVGSALSAAEGQVDEKAIAKVLGERLRTELRATFEEGHTQGRGVQR